jgi:hypothetical protein
MESSISTEGDSVAAKHSSSHHTTEKLKGTEEKEVAGQQEGNTAKVTRTTSVSWQIASSQSREANTGGDDNYNHEDDLESVPLKRKSGSHPSFIASASQLNLSEVYIKNVLAASLDNGAWIQQYEGLPRILIELIAFVSYLVNLVDDRDINNIVASVKSSQTINASAGNLAQSSSAALNRRSSANMLAARMEAQERKSLIYANFYRKISSSKNLRKAYNFIYSGIMKEPSESFRQRSYAPLFIKILTIMARPEIDAVLRDVCHWGRSMTASKLDIVVTGNSEAEKSVPAAEATEQDSGVLNNGGNIGGVLNKDQGSAVGLNRDSSASFASIKFVSTFDLADTHPGSRNLSWRIFEKFHVAGANSVKDSATHAKNAAVATPTQVHYALWSLALRLEDNNEHDRALNVIEAIEKSFWDFSVYRLAIRLHIEKHPSDLSMAERLLKEYLKSSLASYKDNEGFHGEPVVSLEQGKLIIIVEFN